MYKSKRRTWDGNNMVEAIKALREKRMGLKKAVKEFAVPKSTLRRFVHSDLAPEVAVSNCLQKKFVKRNVEKVTTTNDDSPETDYLSTISTFGMFDFMSEEASDGEDSM